MNLAQTQALFWTALHDQIDDADLDRCFAGSPEVPAAERVAIYENMYLWRLVDALREDFPKLVSLLGDETFAALMTEYLTAFPSESPDIGDLGRAMERFLRDRRPESADMAKLEWARVEVFSEASSEPIPATALSEIPPNDVPAAKFQFTSALRVLEFTRDPLPLWRAIEDDQPPPEMGGPAFAAVWRSGFEVFHTALSPIEAEALVRATAGRSFAEICEAFGDATAALGAIGSWFREGWIAAI